MKKIFYIFSTLIVCFILTGCSEANIEGTLPEIMEKLYEGISEEEMPAKVENIELNDETFKYYAFTEVDYKEAIASEYITDSIPHSVVLIRLNNSKDAENVVKEIEKNADPRKWIWVEAKNTYVLSKGDLVVLIMSDELAPRIKENFENLK